MEQKLSGIGSEIIAISIPLNSPKLQLFSEKLEFYDAKQVVKLLLSGYDWAG